MSTRVLVKRRQAKEEHHLLNRQKQVITSKLRTWHLSRLNTNIHSKFKMSSSSNHSWGIYQQTEEQTLQQWCPILGRQRKVVWPVFTSLQSTLYDNIKKLKKTTSFFGVTVMTAKIGVHTNKIAMEVKREINMKTYFPYFWRVIRLIYRRSVSLHKCMSIWNINRSKDKGFTVS